MPFFTPTAVGTPGAVVTSANNVATPTTLTPGTGSGYAVGDVLLCYTACRSATPTVATPSGWTSLLNVTGTNGRMALFGKVAASTTEAAPSVVWSSLTIGTSGTPVSARVQAFRNIAPSVDVTGTVANGAASTATSVGGTGITSLQDSDLVLSLTTRLDDAFTTFTAPAGFSGVLADGSTSGLDFAIAWAYQVKTTAGAVSAPSFGLTGASSFASSGVMVALKATAGATDSASGTVTASGSGTEVYFLPSRYDSIIDVDNPVSHWKLGETTQATDRKGVRNLPAMNGPISTAAGLLDSAASGSANTFVRASGQSFGDPIQSSGVGTPYNAGPWSQEVWIKPTTLTNTSFLIGRGNNYILLNANGSLTLGIAAANGNFGGLQTSAGLIQANNTYHLVGSFDGSVSLLYVNGAEVFRSTVPQGFVSTPDASPFFGGDSVVNEGIDGVVDEAAIYNVALSAARVLAHYNAGIPTAYDQVIDVDSPVSHWKMGDTDRAYDRKSVLNLPAVGASIPTADSIVAKNNDNISNVFTKATTDYFGVPNATGSGIPYEASTWSIEAWVKLNAFADFPNAGTVFSRLNNLLVQSYPGNGQPRDGEWTLWYSASYPTGLMPVLGVPYHLVITYDGTTLRFYIDAVLKRTLDLPPPVASPDTGPNIGAYPGDPAFPGVIDEVAYYNTTLSDVRVAAHFSAGSPGDFGSGTITSSGSGVESAIYADAGAITITTSGSRSESATYTDARTTTITASGSSTESSSDTDSGSGTVTASGNGVESWSTFDSATGVVTASGTKVESYAYVDSFSGTVTASGIAVENSVYIDVASSTILVSGISVESHTTLTSVARVSLEGGFSPTTRTEHKLCFRARKTSGSEPVRLWATLYEGSTNRSGDLVSGELTTDLALYVLPIPDAGAASISSYGDLELRFWGESSQGSTASVEVADAWLELPSPSLTYSGVVFADGPIAYWRGTIPAPPDIDLQIVDQTGRGNYLRLWHAGPDEATWPKDVPSLIASDSADPAMSFIPNSNAWRDNGTQGLDFAPKPELSLELWCKPRAGAVSGSTWHDLARKGTYYGLTIEYQAGNYVFSALAADVTNGVIRRVYSPSPVVADTTYHVVFTLDTTNLRLYVDGALVATQALVGNFNVVPEIDNFTLGQYFLPDNGYNGVLDEIALYDYALTSTQVQTHHDVGTSFVSDTTAPIPIVTVVDVTKISRVVGKDAVNVTFTTDEDFVEYEVRRVSSGSDPRAAGNQVETATVSSRTSHSVVITDDELIAAAAIEGSNTLKIFVKDLAGNWSS